MKLPLLCSGLFLSTALISHPLYALENTQTYKNKRGSILELTISADNKIEGYFTTAVASKSCPDAVGTKRPIVGYITGNALTFSVVYPMCNSVLSFSGNFTKHTQNIDTLSILVHQASDITHEGPGARFIGHDTYKKIN
ncbi:MAG: hypothetical protein EPN84_11995 [Legionella sp.]|nr:MAG: hypothetical protein EPN84_11995 [Legionella sp.]